MLSAIRKNTEQKAFPLKNYNFHFDWLWIKQFNKWKILVYHSTRKKLRNFCLLSLSQDSALELHEQPHPIPLSDWSGLVWYIHLYLERDEELGKKKQLHQLSTFVALFFSSRKILVEVVGQSEANCCDNIFERLIGPDWIKTSVKFLCLWVLQTQIGKVFTST